MFDQCCVGQAVSPLTHLLISGTYLLWLTNNIRAWKTQVRNSELTELRDDAMCRENLQQADQLKFELEALKMRWEEHHAEVGRSLAHSATRAKRFEQLRRDVADTFERQLNLRVCIQGP
jgi:hypothetical protein